MANYPETLTILNGLTSAPTPPTFSSGNGWGVVPDSWRGGGVEEFDIDVHATGSNAVTVAKLVAGTAELLASLTTKNVGTVDFANNQLDISGHPYVTGDGPVQLTVGTTIPTGLKLLTDYYIIVIDANTVELAETLKKALMGVFVAFTDAGTGTLTLTKGTTAYRMKWLSQGLLGESADGAITLTSAMGWRGRAKHDMATVAYALVASFGSSVATTGLLRPQPLKGR